MAAAKDVPLDAAHCQQRAHSQLIDTMYWQALWEFLKLAFRSNHAAMLHCRAGAHRAGRVVAAALMALRRIQPDEAIRCLRNVRNLVNVTRALSSGLLNASRTCSAGHN